jgi:hypothetical protein
MGNMLRTRGEMVVQRKEEGGRREYPPTHALVPLKAGNKKPATSRRRLSAMASAKAWRKPSRRQQMANQRQVREWCQSLGVLTAVSISRQEADIKLAAYVPMLMERFPSAAFTPWSLEFVAAKAVKGFPTYGEIAEWLATWWRENRPITNALPAPTQRYAEPERQPPTDDERAYVRQRVAEITAILQANDANRTLSPSRDPGPRHLSPAQLDIVNPLPNGAKRLTGASR